MSIVIVSPGVYTVSINLQAQYTIEVNPAPAYTIEVVEPTPYNINIAGTQGIPGAPGEKGDKGDPGDPGLNEITTSTATNITGILKGNGTNVLAAVAGTDYGLGTVTSVGITAGTGISVSGSPVTGSGSITVTNSAPDQTVTITAGTGINVTGTYPNFTIQNTQTSAQWGNITGTLSSQTDLQNALNAKQDTLVSGTNIKTVNSNSLLGSGNVSVGTVTSVGLTMPSAFSVANSPVTGSGTLAVTGAGLADQYIRGDGSLANFPASVGGGSSVSYYLNGSVNQGTFGGNTYYEMNRTPVIGSGTNFTIGTNGYIAQFITDAGDPALLSIPAGNWDFQLHFSASSGGGNPQFYTELYKYNGTNFTLIVSGSSSPQSITSGTAADVYSTTLAVPATSLTLTDRLAIRVYVLNSGRTITLYTEDNKLAEIHTTFSTGLAALNDLTTQVQYLGVGTSGTDFNIASATDTHTFNLPTASATNRGALSSTDWSTFNNKQAALVSGTNIKTVNSNSLLGSGNVSVGTVTSVGLTTGTTGTDVNVSGSPVTGSSSITLNIPTASATNRGVLSSADWTTFNSKEPALTKGNLTEATSSVLTITGGTGSVIGSGTSIQVKQASGSQSGFLSSTDWTTFNNKASENAYTRATRRYSEVEETTLRLAAGNNPGSIPGSKFSGLGSWQGGVETDNNYVQGNTGTTATGSATLRYGDTNGIFALYIPTSNYFTWSARVRIPTLNDGTQKFYVNFGILSTIPAAALTEGVGFLYDLDGTTTGSTASANWQTYSINNSTRTFNQNYTATAVAANTWVKLRIVFNDTDAKYYIDDVLVATHTTNIPAGDNIAPCYGIIKTAGLTSRSYQIDYTTIDIEYTTPR